MKKLKICLVFFLIFLMNTVKSQEIRHVITPNIIIGNSEKNSFSIETAINFKTEPYINVCYLITEKIAVFGSYNFINWRNRRILFLKGLYGNSDYDFVENNNQGYQFGIGILDVFKLRKYKNTEILLGFENQHLKIMEYYPKNKDDIDFINQNYNKYFVQINIIKPWKNEKFTIDYSLKTSYFINKSLENQRYFENNLQKVEMNKNGIFMLDLSSSLEYQFNTSKHFFLRFQTGVSAALEDFDEYVNREGFWGFQSNISLIYRLHKQ